MVVLNSGLAGGREIGETVVRLADQPTNKPTEPPEARVDDGQVEMHGLRARL